MFKSLLSLILITFASTLYAGGLGVNISLPERGGTFVDMIKEHHRWLDPNTWSPLEATDFDDMGWPATDAMLMMDQRPVAEWAGEIDDPEAYRVDYSGVYACSFTGQAEVSSQGTGSVHNVEYDAESNTTTFDFEVGRPSGSGYGFFVIAFQETRRTPEDAVGSGITHFQLIRPDYEPDTDRIFLDAFIEALTQPKFAAIRYKDFTGTDSGDPDYPGVTEWSDRSLPEHASQKRIAAVDKLGGAAWGYVIELSNRVRIDPWINVPVSATEDYITQLAMMFKEELDPDLNIYVESSNEVWNTAPAYQQSQWNKAQAEELGIGEHSNHVRRTVEIAQLFEDVFGKGSLNNRIRVILCSHAPMLKWWVTPAIDYIESTGVMLSDYVYALSCQSYFGGGADAGESVEKILADCRQRIDNHVDEPGGNHAGRKQWIAKAHELGLPGGFCFYEGGPDHGGGSTVNVENRIRAERSQEMAEVFKYNYQDGFFDLGGNLAIQFTLTSAYNRYGCWGLTDDIHNPDRNYKFQAARELIAATGVEQRVESPQTFQLLPLYPNPFNPTTTIRFELHTASPVRLLVFNAAGQYVDTVLDDKLSAGSHNVTWNAKAMASGVYLFKLIADNRVVQQKGVLLR